MPNPIAYLALMSWPFVCAELFDRLLVERALIWSILAGCLLLPPMATCDLPLVPEFNKFSIPSIMAFLLVVFVKKSE